jgi:2-oxoisovalerate dehydrogenase E1 component
LAVYAAAAEALQRARSGGGPTLIECKTYRTRSHAEGMRDAGYRTTDEVEAWKQRDPLLLLANRMLAAGIVDQGDFDTIEADVKAIVADAYEFARNSPWPDPASATDFVLSLPAETGPSR